jgi:hypothetical protein
MLNGKAAEHQPGLDHVSLGIGRLRQVLEGGAEKVVAVGAERGDEAVSGSKQAVNGARRGSGFGGTPRTDSASRPPSATARSPAARSAAAVASMYAASYPVRGLVNVEGTVDIRPMAELIRRLEAVLRSDRFADAFAPFQQSMGFEHVPEPLRTRELESQDIRQQVVLGYWEQLFRQDARELQREIEATMASIEAPRLSVFGHDLSASERAHLREHVCDVQIEEWPDRGHLVHLAEPDKFAARLRTFIDHCRSDTEPRRIGHNRVTTPTRMDERKAGRHAGRRF